MTPLVSPLRWAGSKKWALPALDMIYQPHRGRRLVEPFVGGMNVALGLRPERALLADVNHYLINFYRHLRAGLTIYGEMLNEEAFYYAQRDRFNALIAGGGVEAGELAVLFYYLNCTDFNGLCRFNSDGFFNVPFGKRRTVNFRRDFAEYREVLANWAIVCCDFAATFRTYVEEDDFVFADPPYDDGFVDYSKDGFTWEQQVQLAKLLASHPGPVVATNKATSRILQLYGDLGFKIDVVGAPRSISADGDREDAAEIFAVKNIDAVSSTGLNVHAVAGAADPARVARADTSTRTNTSTDTNAGTNTNTRSEHMVNDVSGDVAGLISGAKVFGGSDNIRHGKYLFLIKRIFAQKVIVEAGEHRMAFWELTPLESLPNPQVEGDHVDYPGTSGPLKDDGTKPNAVGTDCALKVDFDGPGARSAGANIKAAILALFGRRDGEISDDEINKTWIDLSRVVPLRKGEPIGVDPVTKQVIVADKDKVANPACGMVIRCRTMAKRKRTPNDKGAFVTKMIWECASPPGTGENAPELVAKRRAEIEAAMAAAADDEEDGTGQTTAAPPPPGQIGHGQGSVFAPPPPANGAAAVPPPPPAPPAPPAPPPAAFTPVKPWVQHPSAPVGATPETRYYWSDPKLGGDNKVKSEHQLVNGL